ncbi:hypothetical protein QE152_g4574 [Popillia japonica]|uniref:Uncharacterized protein n=1 Tax=Popillia japonica TaxID=7064 RepID=A0AAW1MXN5_POPJA
MLNFGKEVEGYGTCKKFVATIKMGENRWKSVQKLLRTQFVKSRKGRKSQKLKLLRTQFVKSRKGRKSQKLAPTHPNTAKI